MRARAAYRWLLGLALSGTIGLSSSSGDTQEDEGEIENDIASDELSILNLPEWDASELMQFEEDGRPRNLGGGLWPEEFFPLEATPVPLALDVEILNPDQLPEMAGSPRELSEELAESYFGERPTNALVDPQRLVLTPYRENVERFLKYHVAESAMPTYVLVLSPDQSPPDSLSTADVWRRWFPEGTGAIVLYHIGAPDLTAIEFGADQARRAGRERLQSLLDSCVQDALQTENPSAQLERFCVKFSIQAYWLERDLREEAKGSERPVESTLGNDATRTWWSRNLWAIAIVTACGALIAGAVYWPSRRRPVFFPELEVPTRLGGSFSGGSDAVISFLRSVGTEEERPATE